MELNGRSAIVTGGAGGLGAATARHLLERGVGVVIFDRDATGAAALAGGAWSRARSRRRRCHR